MIYALFEEVEYECDIFLGLHASLEDAKKEARKHVLEQKPISVDQMYVVKCVVGKGRKLGDTILLGVSV